MRPTPERDQTYDKHADYYLEQASEGVYARNFAAFEKLIDTQIRALRRTAYAPGAEPRERRVIAAFEADTAIKLGKLAGHLAVINALQLEGKFDRAEPELLEKEVGHYEKMVAEIHEGLVDMSDTCAIRTPSWEGVPPRPLELNLEGQRGRHNQSPEDLLQVMRETTATAYEQERELKVRHPESQEVGDIVLGRLENGRMTSMLEDARDNRVHTARACTIAIALRDNLPSPPSPESLRNRVTSELNAFARNWKLASRAFAPPSGKTIGSAPVTEEGTLDYETVSRRGLAYVREYRILSEQMPEETRKNVARALDMVHSLSLSIHDVERAGKGIKEEQQQVKDAAKMIQVLDLVGKHVGIESPFKREDFVQAHGNRVRQLEDQRMERQAKELAGPQKRSYAVDM